MQHHWFSAGNPLDAEGSVINAESVFASDTESFSMSWKPGFRRQFDKVKVVCFITLFRQQYKQVII